MKILILLSLLLPSIGWSGMLSYEYLSLSQAHMVLYGTVIAIDKVKHIIKIKTIKIWNKTDKKEQVGKEVSINLNGGVEWTDPGKSPIEIRFNNWKSITEIKLGEKVYIAQGMSDDIIESKLNLSEQLDVIFGPNPYQSGPESPAIKNYDLLYQHLYDKNLYLRAIQEFYNEGEIDLNRFYKVPTGISEIEVDSHFWDLLNKLIIGVQGNYSDTTGKFKPLKITGLEMAKACMKEFAKDKISKKVDYTIQILYNLEDKKVAWEYIRDHLDKVKHPVLYRAVLFNLEKNV